MTDNKTPAKPSISADWFLQGALSRIGDTLDKFTGRRWTPSSSLATSELIERMKRLLDSEARDIDEKGRVVPHNIKLKVQWDKFATDQEDTLDQLREELLTAAADHINDQLYYTYGPLHVEVKQDYFTEGVKLFVTFDTFHEDAGEAEMNVTLPSISIPAASQPGVLSPAPAAEVTREHVYIARFELRGSRRDRRLVFPKSGRLSIGRTSANDLAIEDASISKIHASLVVDRQGQLAVADTGSTNGTFINGERIPYGKALPVKAGDKVKFGTVEIEFENVTATDEPPAEQSNAAAETVEIDGLRFITKTPKDGAEHVILRSSDNTLEIDQEPAVRNSDASKSNE